MKAHPLILLHTYGTVHASVLRQVSYSFGMHPSTLRKATTSYIPNRRLYSVFLYSLIPWRPSGFLVQGSFLKQASISSSLFVGIHMPVSTRRSPAVASIATEAQSPESASVLASSRRTRNRTTLYMAESTPTEEEDTSFPATPVKFASSTSSDNINNDNNSDSSVPAVVTPAPASSSSTSHADCASTSSTTSSTTSTTSSSISSTTPLLLVVPPPTKKRKKTPTLAPLAAARCAPADYASIYELVTELRSDKTAPCDHFGCEALPDRSSSPAEFRFHVLISLMLSSQTKDAVVAEAIRDMQANGVLNVESIARMTPETLNGYIKRVGFHNNKTKYIKQAVEILRQEHAGEIPSTAQTMMELPGVGPKMAFICENVAWNLQSGIGVDTHMHRLFNELQWVKSKTPEQTRVQLEAWLPRDQWAEVNLLWVGFGQEVQQFKPKILRKALDCSRPADALKLLKRCGLDYRREGTKLGLEDEIAKVLVKKDP